MPDTEATYELRLTFEQLRFVYTGLQKLRLDAEAKGFPAIASDTNAIIREIENVTGVRP